MKTIFDVSDAACVSFMGNCLKESSADYLLEILLECSDGTSRNHAGDLIQHCLLKLRTIEKDFLFEKNDKGEPKAYSAIFMTVLFQAFKVRAAKN